MVRVQVSSAMLFDKVAAGEEFTIEDVQWRHTSDSSSERLRDYTMVFRWGEVLHGPQRLPARLMSELQCCS